MLRKVTGCARRRTGSAIHIQRQPNDHSACFHFCETSSQRGEIALYRTPLNYPSWVHEET
jgi:hypothetical protein